mmetsp:Transcript_43531/g.114900  ORF Transcript_43531/g.114900 Transcript_43531/m.114900 type:complete len:102 (-) Transcript_43531:2074-2379(-)
MSPAAATNPFQTSCCEDFVHCENLLGPSAAWPLRATMTLLWEVAPLIYQQRILVQCNMIEHTFAVRTERGDVQRGQAICHQCCVSHDPRMLRQDFLATATR